MIDKKFAAMRDEIRESELKCEEVFNEGFDLGPLKDKKADKYRRKALNYALDIEQTLGAIRGFIEEEMERKENE